MKKPGADGWGQRQSERERAAAQIMVGRIGAFRQENLEANATSEGSSGVWRQSRSWPPDRGTDRKREGISRVGRRVDRATSSSPRRAPVFSRFLQAAGRATWNYNGIPVAAFFPRPDEIRVSHGRPSSDFQTFREVDAGRELRPLGRASGWTRLPLAPPLPQRQVKNRSRTAASGSALGSRLGRRAVGPIRRHRITRMPGRTYLPRPSARSLSGWKPRARYVRATAPPGTAAQDQDGAWVGRGARGWKRLQRASRIPRGSLSE
jgi:hypothetical protein